MDHAFVLKFDRDDSVFIQSSLKDVNSRLNLLSYVRNVQAGSDFPQVLTKGLLLIIIGVLVWVDLRKSVEES